jgi:adenylate kinase
MELSPRHVIIIGPPGSGKGTQAARVGERLGLRHLSTGDLLRDAVAEGTSLGKKAKEYMNEGRLVPDEIMLGLIREQLEALEGAGWILDGFPRTLPQAEALTGLLEEQGIEIDTVLLVDVPAEAIVQRLTSRRVCTECHAVYSLAMLPAGQPDRCPKCGGRLVQRPDDTEETVRRRLDVYEEQTAPVLDFYRRSVGVTEIDGTGDIDGITAEILRVMQ